jgi:hypothetical protein
MQAIEYGILVGRATFFSLGLSSGSGAALRVFPGIQVNTNVFFNTRQKSYDFSKIMIIFVK